MKNLYFWLALLLGSIAFEPIHAHNITFAENKGQWNAAVLYKATIPDGAMFITANGPVYSFSSAEDLHASHHKFHENPDHNIKDDIIRIHSYQFKFVEAQQSKHEASDKTAYYENFFLGNDASQWASHVEHYKKVTQKNIFKNIDAVYYAQGQSLKYDFVLQAGAATGDIKMALEGAQISINSKGQLVIKTSVNTVIEDKPFAYQIVNNDTVAIPCNYTLNENVVGFDVAQYNKTLPLIIDPSLIFATYSGANASNFYSYTSSFDHSNHTILAALGYGLGWPTQLGSYSTTFGGYTDVAVMKLTGDGSTRVFATYLGGSQPDEPFSISTNLQESIFITGFAGSSNFPTTANTFQPTFGGGQGDIFISKLSPDGTQLLASTFLGGSNSDGGNIYSPVSASNLSPTVLRFNKNDHSLWMTSSTNSSNFPTTTNAMQSALTFNGAFIAQVDTNLSQLMYSSFFNTNGSTFFHDIKISNSNKIYLAGNTVATNLGTTNAYLNNFQGGNSDGVVMKFNAISKTIEACTYLGTANTDNARKLAIHPHNGKIYVNGQSAGGSYPFTPGSYNVPNSNNYIQILDTALGNNLGACVFGGADYLNTSDLFVGNCSALGIAGIGYSTSFPLTPDAFSTTGEFWLGNFDLNLSNVIYGTKFGYGGHTHAGTFNFDTLGNIHHSVCDVSGNFVTTANAWSATKQTTGYDMISFKFDISSVNGLLDFELDNNSTDTGCAPLQVGFQNNSYNYTNYYWDFGNGSTSTDFEPTTSYAQTGLYKVLLIGTNPSCGFEDRDSLYVTVQPSGTIAPFASDTIICSSTANIELRIDSLSPDSNLQHYNIVWTPASAVSALPDGLSAVVDHTIANEITVHFSGINTNGSCYIDTSIIIKVLYHDSSHINVYPTYTELCQGDSVLIAASGAQEYEWSPQQYLTFIDASKAFAKPDADISYQISVKDDQDCVYNKTSSVKILPKNEVDAGESKTIRYGETVQLNGRTNANNFYWNYNNVNDYHNVLNPSVAPLDSTLYYLITTHENGCKNMDSVWVYVNDFKTPNAFTPNGDGLNDVFYPIPKNHHAEIKNFSVYNRYGECVFYSTLLGNGWDGTFKNIPCDMGVYFYYAEYKIGTKTYKDKGDVTLMR